MSTVGSYLEYREDTQYHGGYHGACAGIISIVACSVPWGEKSFVI